VDKQYHHPFQEEIDLAESYDEIVVFEKSQTLPLYIIVNN